LATILSRDTGLRILKSGVHDSILVQVLAATQPHVAILNRPQDHATLGLLKEAQRRSALLVMVDRPTRSYVALLATLGIHHITYRSTPQDIHDAVRQAAASTNHRAPPAGDAPADASLTVREREVLQYLVAGASHAETAVALGIGLQTVKTYARNLRRKLGIPPNQRLIRTVRDAD
jgi:DNA-binding NarL/FixJ family response regulator